MRHSSPNCTNRPTQGRLKKVYFLILCKGKTEAIYFELLRERGLCSDGIAEAVIKTKVAKPDNLCKKAKEQESKREKEPGRRYDRVWIVVDQDNHGLAEIIQEATASKYCVAWSSLAFEHWLLLHFRPNSQSYTVDQYKKEISKEFSKYQLKMMYEKGDEKCIRHILDNGDISKAIERAGKQRENYEKDGEFELIDQKSYTTEDLLLKQLLESIGWNPYTRLDLLVKQLQNPSSPPLDPPCNPS